jgi:hypothetical protein
VKICLHHSICRHPLLAGWGEIGRQSLWYTNWGLELLLLHFMCSNVGPCCTHTWACSIVIVSRLYVPVNCLVVSLISQCLTCMGLEHFTGCLFFMVGRCCRATPGSNIVSSVASRSSAASVTASCSFTSNFGAASSLRLLSSSTSAHRWRSSSQAAPPAVCRPSTIRLRHTELVPPQLCKCLPLCIGCLIGFYSASICHHFCSVVSSSWDGPLLRPFINYCFCILVLIPGID